MIPVRRPRAHRREPSVGRGALGFDFAGEQRCRTEAATTPVEGDRDPGVEELDREERDEEGRRLVERTTRAKRRDRALRPRERTGDADEPTLREPREAIGVPEPRKLAGVRGERRELRRRVRRVAGRPLPRADAEHRVIAEHPERGARPSMRTAPLPRRTEEAAQGLAVRVWVPPVNRERRRDARPRCLPVSQEGTRRARGAVTKATAKAAPAATHPRANA